MFSNQQIFTNNVFPNEATNSNFVSNHTIGNSVSIGCAWPSLIAGICIFIVFCLLWAKDSILRKYLPNLLYSNPKISEGLKPYTQSLDKHDRKWLIADETHMREVHNMPMFTDEYFDRLKHSATLAFFNRKKISNVFSYDILANADYTEMFQYYGVNERTEDEEIFDCDTIRKVIYMPYLSEEQGKPAYV